MSDSKQIKGGDGQRFVCSFCGKSHHEVRKLIAGPSVFICDECVEACNDILREEMHGNGNPAATDDITSPIIQQQEKGNKIRVILIHGVGMPVHDPFGDQLEDNVRKLNLATEPTFTSINWHQIVEKPSFLFNSMQLAELMKGFVGAAWRGHLIKLPLQLLDIMLVLAPFCLWLSTALFLYQIQDALANEQPPTRWLQGPVWILWKSLAWPLPLSIYEYAPRALFGYLSVVVTVTAITFLLCTLCCRASDAIRVVTLTLIRPIIFFLAIPTRPAVFIPLAVSVAVSAAIAWGWGDPLNPQLEVFPHDTLVVVPMASLTAGEEVWWSVDYLPIFFGLLISAIVMVVMIGMILVLPLKVLADVICYIGNREYCERLLDHVEKEISPTQIGDADYLILVGHSLGSVIALDWLLRSKKRMNPSLRIALVTMGSPLRRFISRFFFMSFPTPDAAAEDLSLHFREFRWINVYRPFDPIGASLFRVRNSRTQDCSTGQFSKLGIRAHTGYWDDEAVVARIHAFLAIRDTVTEPTVLEPQGRGAEPRLADDGVQFLERLSHLIPGMFAWFGVLVLAVYALMAGVPTYRERLDNTHAQHREHLRQYGVPTSGWVYTFARNDALPTFDNSSYGFPGKVTLPPPSFVPVEIIVYKKQEGTYIAYDLSRGLGVHWLLVLLQYPPWARTFEEAIVRERYGHLSGEPSFHDREARRWPVAVRYLPNDPSKFDIVDLELQADAEELPLPFFLQVILVSGQVLGTIPICLYLWWVLYSFGRVYCGYGDTLTVSELLDRYG